MERNLLDAMNVARNVMVEAKLVPGGGAGEMALAQVCTNLLTDMQIVSVRSLINLEIYISLSRNIYFCSISVCSQSKKTILEQKKKLLKCIKLL